MFCDFEEDSSSNETSFVETNFVETSVDTSVETSVEMSVDDFIEHQLRLQEEVTRQEAEKILEEENRERRRIEEEFQRQKVEEERRRVEEEFQQRQKVEEEKRRSEEKRRREEEERRRKQEESSSSSSMIYPLPSDLAEVFQGTLEWQQQYEDNQQRSSEIKSMEESVKNDLQQMYQYIQVPPNFETSIGWFCLSTNRGPRKPEFVKVKS